MQRYKLLTKLFEVRRSIIDPDCETDGSEEALEAFMELRQEAGWGEFEEGQIQLIGELEEWANLNL